MIKITGDRTLYTSTVANPGLQVQMLYPRARIEAYGSVASNLPMQDSDVDLCIVFDGVEVCQPLSDTRKQCCVFQPKM